jgi:hypothetical protein
MKRAALIALGLLAVAATAATTATGGGGADPGPHRCGGILWRLKTLSDPARMTVALTPRTTTIEAIRERPYPRPIPRKRRTPFQMQTWKVIGQLTDFRLDDGGVRLILYDANEYLQAVIPLPSCLSESTRARAKIARVFRDFISDCGEPTRDWRPLGPIVAVEGVGFWSQRRGRRGAAPNGAELHPVTGFRILAGC